MTAIDDFLNQKDLSHNSETAYRYDLEQFRQVVEGNIEAGTLRHYQQFLGGLKSTAQKRKLSAVNQFLYFLYETGQLKQYHKLSLSVTTRMDQVIHKPKAKLMDLSILWQETAYATGQLFALLIWQLGLLPSEILQLKASDLELDFKVITVSRGSVKRVLKLPNQLLPYLENLPKEGLLFAKNERPYSRQWFSNQLNHYLKTLGLTELTAQKLREQYILEQLERGLSLEQVAKALGLKSTVTLEKYWK
ncbi:site-specific tyrosine recombinase XerD [Streptococcus moroccensis]|uniref:Tyrosine recombinase XerD-like n=1 Tax=Streptococcus moroccensis TaxID=1451356 RepID=A0ABT9YQH7_9STRE|nr:site-specific tyrosine recombinase XerD [Streptococcus moroccensis]MDQ0222251.1 site-specific recombinase XerD [Streptococcus moroccensis]